MKAGARVARSVLSSTSIIDGPPLVPVTDALVVAAQVSGVVLVVHGGKTPKAAVQKARNLLMSVDAKILGRWSTT